MMFIERKNPSLCMALPEGQTLFLLLFFAKKNLFLNVNHNESTAKF